VRGVPARAPHVAARLGGLRSSGIGLATLRAGSGAIATAIASLGEQGVRVAVVDAETDEDLHALVAAARGRDDLLWVGSAGLIESLASAELGPATHRREPEDAVPARRVLFLIGSPSAVTHEQIASFAPPVATETLDPRALLRGDTELEAAIARAAAALDETGVALVAIGSEPQVAHAGLRAAFVAAAAPLARDRDDLTIVLSGGDIARAFCETFGIRGLAIYEELAPGIPRSRAVGALFDLVTKAGGFGTPHTYGELRRILRERAQA